MKRSLEHKWTQHKMLCAVDFRCQNMFKTVLVRSKYFGVQQIINLVQTEPISTYQLVVQQK